MKIVCVIPARLGSLRFPRKVLCMLGNQPLLQWVWEAATRCPQFDEVVFAIDDQETAALIDSFGGKYLMSSPHCTCGTERLIELLESGYIQGDVWVNWQGDEPFIRSEGLASLIEIFKSDTKKDVDLASLMIPVSDEMNNPNVVKVITDLCNRALYFSRSAIPHQQSKETRTTVYKHVGVYAFRKSALIDFYEHAPTPLELAEQIEAIRYLEMGKTIK